MAITPNATFRYSFSVQALQRIQSAELLWSDCPESAVQVETVRWTGSGSGQASFGESDGMAGRQPRFELSGGWLTLFPTEGWINSFPRRWFSDEKPLQPVDLDAQLAASKKDRQEELEIVKRSGGFSLEALENARKIVQRRNGRIRDLVSYSLFVGSALEKVLRTGDELTYVRDGNGDFYYSVQRDSETIFSAGSVPGRDRGGPAAVFQQYDEYPNPNAESLKAKLKNVPEGLIAKSIRVHRPYITARVKDQIFLLLDGQEVHVDPYYVYLARSNQNVPAIAFEFTPRAVHSLGRLDGVHQNSIVDAAQHLIAPQTKML